MLSSRPSAPRRRRGVREPGPMPPCRGRDGPRLFAPVACLRRLRRSAGTTLWGDESRSNQSWYYDTIKVTRDTLRLTCGPLTQVLAITSPSPDDWRRRQILAQAPAAL